MILLEFKGRSRFLGHAERFGSSSKAYSEAVTFVLQV
jgi:hypothetical protein